MTKEQKAVVKKWVSALRSGKFRQGTSALATRDDSKHCKYCCLGVLCELAVKEGVIKKVYVYSSYKRYDDLEKEQYYLPAKVRDWVGLNTKRGTYSKTSLAQDNDNGGTYSKTSLAQDNDNGLKFKEIADIIESNPKGLFE